MLSHNIFHDGRVQSIGYELQGRRVNAGAMLEGDFFFDISTPERMTVLSGELQVRVAGQTTFVSYPAGSSFEVAANCRLEIKVERPSAYLCEFS